MHHIAPLFQHFLEEHVPEHPSNGKIHDTANLVLQNGQSIQYVNKSRHLGNELCPINKKVLPLNAVDDLNCRLNNLLADFSYCDSKTLSVLFRRYCMNVYGSQIWAFNKAYFNFMWRGEMLLEESGSYLIELITIYWI